MEWKHNFRIALMSRERVSLNWEVPPQLMLSRSCLVFNFWRKLNHWTGETSAKVLWSNIMIKWYNSLLFFIEFWSLLLLFQNQRSACLSQNLLTLSTAQAGLKKRYCLHIQAQSWLKSFCCLVPLLQWHRDYLLHSSWISGTEKLIRNWKVCDLWIKWSENMIW